MRSFTSTNRGIVKKAKTNDLPKRVSSEDVVAREVPLPRKGRIEVLSEVHFQSQKRGLQGIPKIIKRKPYHKYVSEGTLILFLNNTFISEYSVGAPALIKRGNSQFLGVRLIGISVDKLLEHNAKEEKQQNTNSESMHESESIMHEPWDTPHITSL